MKIAIVTGATAGIGKATALKLASLGYNVIITGRRKERLEELEAEIKDKYGVDVLALNFDVRNWNEVEKYLGGLPEEWKAVDVLVNNAGLAVGFGPINEGDPKDWDTMIDTNIKGLLYVSKVVMQYMIKRQKGHIINIASVAGKEVYYHGNVYCATKHAVDALSKAMRIDLLPHNIKITNVAPGMADTEFSIVRYKGNKEKADRVYRGFEPLHAEDIADVIEFLVTRPDHVTINDILVMPTAQANTSHLIRNEE